MFKYISNSLLALMLVTSTASANGEQEFGADGIKVVADSIDSGVFGKKAQYEIHQSNGCTLFFTISADLEGEQTLSKFEKMKKQVRSATARGHLEKLFTDQVFMEGTTIFSYGCPDNKPDDVLQSGMDKRDRAVHHYRSNGDILSVILNRSSGYELARAAEALLDNADPKDFRFSALDIQYIGCDYYGVQARQNHENAYDEEVKPEDFKEGGKFFNDPEKGYLAYQTCQP